MMGSPITAPARSMWCDTVDGADYALLLQQMLASAVALERDKGLFSK